jgi:hypothetical protein
MVWPNVDKGAELGLYCLGVEGLGRRNATLTGIRDDELFLQTYLNSDEL